MSYVEFVGVPQAINVPVSAEHGPFIVAIKLGRAWLYAAYLLSDDAAEVVAEAENLGMQVLTGVLCDPPNYAPMDVAA